MSSACGRGVTAASTLGIVALLAFTSMYLRAVKRVHDDDPRKQPPVVATEYLAAPKHLDTGAAFSREEIIAYLERVGYKRGRGREPGTYDGGDNALVIEPRQSDFNALKIEWAGSRVARISDLAGTALAESELEPESLGLHSSVVSEEQLRVRRYLVTFDDLRGTAALDALVSSEDSGFFNHGGVSLVNTVIGPLQHRGGSTLTQQLARACILHDTALTLSRKVNEMFLAMSLEAQLPKSDIVTTYCNCAYWGNAGGGLQLYGIAAAARLLFGKSDLRSLTLSQSAALAALLNQPARYLHEIRQGNSDRLRNQRNRVLRLMGKNFAARYSADEIARAESEPISLVPDRKDEQTDLEQNSRYFLDYLSSKAPRPEPGTRIYTTLDADMQRAAVNAITNGVRRLESEYGGTTHLQAAMVVLSRSGDLLAMVGGTDYGLSQLNRAVQAKRSPGSVMKPFVQIPALESGVLKDEPFTLATVIDPGRDPVQGNRPKGHCGGAATDRTLLARSDNCAAAVVGTIATLPRAQEILRAAINANPELGVPMLIGGAKGSEVSPLDLALGYSMFVNAGVKVNVRVVSAVYKDGRRITQPAEVGSRIADPGPTFLVTQAMRSVVGDAPEQVNGATAGRAKSAAQLPASVQVAGKTGTGQVADLWFVTVMPKGPVAVIWVGSDENKPLPLSAGWAGGTASVPIWIDFMREIADRRPDLMSGEFDMPEGIEIHSIDPLRGCVTESGSGLPEYFLKGRVPAFCVLAVKSLAGHGGSEGRRGIRANTLKSYRSTRRKVERKK